MNSKQWLFLAKERIEAVLHNYPENTYLKDAIRFINEAMLTKSEQVNDNHPANDYGEDLGTTYNEVQMNDHKREGFK